MAETLVTMEFDMSPQEMSRLRSAATAMRITPDVLARRAVSEWIEAKPSADAIALAEDLDALASNRADDDDALVLISLVRHFRAEASRLEHLMTADLSVLRTGDEKDGFNLETGGRAVAILAGQMAAWLRGNEAENYTETAFSHYEAPYLVTVQRNPWSDQTPHRFRLAAEARADAAEARAEAADARVAELEGRLAALQA